MVGLPQDCDHLPFHKIPTVGANRAVEPLEVQRAEVVPVPLEEATLTQVAPTHFTKTHDQIRRKVSQGLITTERPKKFTSIMEFGNKSSGVIKLKENFQSAVAGSYVWENYMQRYKSFFGHIAATFLENISQAEGLVPTMSWREHHLVCKKDENES